MNLKTLKQILELELPEDTIKEMVLQELASYENTIPNILKIIDTERKNKKELIFALNLNLSRAHIYLESDQRKEPRSSPMEKSFLMNEIQKFYEENNISHCFNRFNKEK